MPVAAPPEGARDAEHRRAFQRAIAASDDAMARLDAYRDLLAKWSAEFNLVGPSVLPEFWLRHALDSAQLLSLAPSTALRWADIGSGAGFPGLVLAILMRDRPGARLQLIESVSKRCRFLDHVASALNLPVAVLNARSESLVLEPDVVTARACAPLPRLLDYAAPHLQGAAIGLFLKGRDVESELTAARARWRFDAALLPSLSDPSGRILKVTRLARA